MGNSWNFQNCKFFEFPKLQILGIFQFRNFSNFPNFKFFECSKLQIFRFSKLVFAMFLIVSLEFFKWKIFRIFQTGNFRNRPN